MSASVVLRASSGPDVGMGHAVRTGAVARAVAERGARAVVLVDDEATSTALRERGLDARVAGEDGWLAAARGARSAWLDGFRDWSRELAELGAAGVVRFLIENRTPARALADWLVYPALHHADDDWDRAHAARVLAGAPWIPLAPEVAALEPGAAPRDTDLLVTFGGSDPLGSTERVLAALARLETAARPSCLVSVGRHLGPRRAAIEGLAAELGHARVLPTGAPLAESMARCRRAVTAVGTTLYELAHLRVPALVLANFAGDRDALAHYGEHGPHRPLGVAPELTDAEVAAGLAAFLATGGEPAWPQGLGSGASRLAERLVTPVVQAPSRS